MPSPVTDDREESGSGATWTDRALALGRNLGARRDGTVVVGWTDARRGALLADVLSAGVRERGADVVDAGHVSTPALARCVRRTGASAGVSIGAERHGPWKSGFEFREASGRPVDAEKRRELWNHVETDARCGSSATWGSREPPARDPAALHRETVADAVDVPSALHVVVDVGDGVGRATAETLGELGCDVTTIGTPTRPTAHHPQADLSEVHCEDLCEFVAASGADLGIAHDPTGGRTAGVTETGRFVTGDALLVTFARRAAAEGDAVVVPVDASRAVETNLEPMGASVERTRAGERPLATGLDDLDAAFAGAPDGSWIWPGEAPGRDGTLAACKLASLVAANGSFDGLVEGVETYPIHRESIEVESPENVVHGVHEAAMERYGPDAVTSTDGVRVDLDDGWFLVRTSDHGRDLLVTAEAEEPAVADRYHQLADDLVFSVAEAGRS